MNKTGTALLTAISALLYVFLTWAFADDLWFGKFWDSHAITASSLWTWVLFFAIIIAGVYQYMRSPDEDTVFVTGSPVYGHIDEPRLWRNLVSNVNYALFWMPIRFFVGQEWAIAGEHKVRDDAWMSGGTALKGYFERQTAIPEQGRPAITYSWFRDFLDYMLRNEWYTWFAKIIAVGELLVGLGLIVGALVGIAAFFGTLMNFNFQLAGSASTNPVLFGLGVFLVLAWKVAGHYGLDRYLLPALGTPWEWTRKDQDSVVQTSHRTA